MAKSQKFEDSLIYLWILRALVKLRGNRRFAVKNYYADDELAVALGLLDAEDICIYNSAAIRALDVDMDALGLDLDSKYDRGLVLRNLRCLYSEAESRKAQLGLPKTIKGNISKLGRLIKLDNTEKMLLEFALLMVINRPLNVALDFLGDLSISGCEHALAVIMGLPETKVHRALSASGVLARSGLLTLNANGAREITRKLELLSTEFAERMMEPSASPIHLLRDSVTPCSGSKLSMRDYQYLGPQLTVLNQYLQGCDKNRSEGVNILIYGQPGTGKSELARALAKSVGVSLYEVSATGTDDEAIIGRERLKALRAAQIFLSKQHSMLLFDEVEDVFNDGGLLSVSSAQARKGWLNRTLETNAVPTLWVTNDIQCMDPAFIRRFDVCLEVDIPPLDKRKKIVAQHCSRWVDAKAQKKLAACEQVAPAVITRASKVIAAISNDAKKQGVSAAQSDSLLTLIDSTLQAQGHGGLDQYNTGELPNYYCTDFINSSADLKEMSKLIRAQPNVRMCLYGPPGTGKSAYVHWLSKTLEKPLNSKKPSDLQSMYVGGTEANIAKAFKQSEREGSILLIDEVDGFLQDRRQSKATWESTMVNEMLTQMEAFKGVFVSTTNLIDGLDHASLRRFDIKLKFDYLSQQQCWMLFVKTCKSLGIVKYGVSLKPKLQRLDRLTPGDFAMLARQSKFQPMHTGEEFLTRLGIEQQLKQDHSSRRIGF